MQTGPAGPKPRGHGRCGWAVADWADWARTAGRDGCGWAGWRLASTGAPAPPARRPWGPGRLADDYLRAGAVRSDLADLISKAHGLLDEGLDDLAFRDRLDDLSPDENLALAVA